MAKYINLDHLIRFIKENGYVYASIIENWPTVDAVEVVRCKDCIYRENEGQDILFCSNFSKDMMPDDYCSCGERRENVTQM